MSLANYKDTLRDLSDALVRLQRPIRILDAIKWPPSVREAFFRADFRELPRVDRGFYADQGINFDTEQVSADLKELQTKS